jgi:hypothetical protein
MTSEPFGYRAILIGSGTYDDSTLANLLGPENDVHALDSALIHEDWGLFRPKDITTLINESRRGVQKELRHFFDRATPDDVLLVYFSGHGKNVGGGLYFCLRDTENDRLEATGLSASDVSAYIARCSSQRVVILLDCCHSGAFKGSLDTSELQGTGRFVLSSTHAEGQSPDAKDPDDLSPFTEYVCDALTGEAADVDDRVTFRALVSYMEERVDEAVRSVTPGRGDLDLARRGGLRTREDLWLQVFDSEPQQPDLTPVPWPVPPTEAEAAAVLTRWAERQWFMSRALIQEPPEIRAASVAGLTVDIDVLSWEEKKLEWPISKYRQLPEYRGQVRFHEVAGFAAGATWSGSRRGTKIKRRCPSCFGDGTDTCHKCKSGRIECAPEQSCPKCRGRARAQGTARPVAAFGAPSAPTSARQVTPICSECKDTGAARCSKCLGQGWQPCPTCDGKGKVRCTKCEGECQLVSFVHGSKRWLHEKFRVTASESSTPVAGWEPLVVGSLDKLDLRELPPPILDQLRAQIRERISHENEECTSMTATLDIFPAAEVTFRVGGTSNTALFLGSEPIVHIPVLQQFAIRKEQVGALLRRTANTVGERPVLIAAILIPILLAAMIAFLSVAH